MKKRGANMSALIKLLKQAFKDKDYRHGYADEFLNSSIATQIKVLREQRGWSQKELAQSANMKQPRISVMENVNYSSWSIKILRELAEAFDLTLCVSFETFGKRLADIERFNRENLERLSFEDDPIFVEREERNAPTEALTSFQVPRELSDKKTVLRLMPSQMEYSSAATAQSAIRPQVEDAMLMKRDSIGIERELARVA
jgi:transcriptional regulator with XRE-family HTH domain